MPFIPSFLLGRRLPESGKAFSGSLLRIAGCLFRAQQFAVVAAEEFADFKEYFFALAVRADYADAVVDAVLPLNQGLADFAVAGHVLGNPAVFGGNAARGVVFVDNYGALLAAAVGTLLLLGGGGCAVGAGFGFHAA